MTLPLSFLEDPVPTLERVRVDLLIGTFSILILEDLGETLGDGGQALSEDEEDVSSSKAFTDEDRFAVCLTLGIFGEFGEKK